MEKFIRWIERAEGWMHKDDLMDKIDNPDKLMMFIDSGRNLDKYLYLHKWRHIECMELALIHGCDPNLQDSNGNTPLHEVIDRIYWGDFESEIPLLLKYGARLNIENNLRLNALEYAVYNRKMFIITNHCECRFKGDYCQTCHYQREHDYLVLLLHNETKKRETLFQLLFNPDDLFYLF